MSHCNLTLCCPICSNAMCAILGVALLKGSYMWKFLSCQMLWKVFPIATGLFLHYDVRPLLTGKQKLEQNKRDCLFCKIPMLTGASNKTNQTSAFVIPGLYKNFYKPVRRFCKSTRSANLQNKPFEFRFNTQHRDKPFEFRFNTQHRDIQSIKQIFIGCLLPHKSTSDR
jgi:hypothetical protein